MICNDFIQEYNPIPREYQKHSLSKEKYKFGIINIKTFNDRNIISQNNNLLLNALHNFIQNCIKQNSYKSNPCRENVFSKDAFVLIPSPDVPENMFLDNVEDQIGFPYDDNCNNSS